MQKFFKNPFVNFFIVSLLFIGVSVLAGQSVETPTQNFLNSTLVEEFLDVSPIPTSTPTSAPEVKGTHLDLPEYDTKSAVVSEVIDGDTIRLTTGEKVRYIGIDTPESVHPTKDKQCFGGEASIENERMVLGKTVILEKDKSETDRYGRLLRYVWLDGEMVNKKLVRDGFAVAKAYKPDVKYQEILEQAQLEAQTANRGLWANCTTK